MASLWLDVIAVLLFVGFVIYYTCRGFVVSLVGLLRFAIASALATLFSPALSGVLQPLVEQNLVLETGEDFFSTLLQKFISSGHLARAIAFILIFIAASLLIKIFEVLFKMMTKKLKLIRFLDHTLGLVMGLVIGFFWVELLVFAGVSLLSYLQGSFQLLPEGTIENTTVIKWIYENNIFNFIIERLMSAVGK